MLTGLRARAAAVRRDGEDGFTLVELLAAMAVISIVLLGLLAVQTQALGTVTLSRQRQQATDLANRTMEQLRALPYDTVAGGLLVTDAAPAGDPSIQPGAGGTLRYRPAHTPAIDELLVTRSVPSCPAPTPSSCPPAPLYPHVQASAQTKIGTVQFRVRTYVTMVVDGATNKGYWLSVDVTWSSPQTGGGTKRVGTRSQTYSPTGCLSTATHPFSGPCQAYFDGVAATTPSSISISSDSAGTPALLGNALTSATVSVPTLSAVVQSEQIVSTQSATTGSQARYTTGVGETSLPYGSATTSGTTDPATGEATTPAHVPVATGSGALVSGTGDNAFTLRTGAADLVADSTTSAVASPAGCRTTADGDVASLQVCSSGSSAGPPSTGTVAASLGYGPTPFDLARIAGGASPSRAIAARYVDGAGAYCTGTSGVGCIAADVKRSLGTAVLGGVPTTASGLPAGFGSALLTVSGFTARARTEAGVGAEVPAAPATPSTPRADARTGSLTWWGPTGYATIDLADGLAHNETLAPTSFWFDGPSGRVDVTVSGSLAVTPPSRTPTGAAPCEPDACGVEESSGAVTAAVTYELRSGLLVVGRFTVNLDLGTASAKTTYRAAPSA